MYIITIIFSIIVLAGCQNQQQHNPPPHINHISQVNNFKSDSIITPESLLDFSNEKVSFSINSQQSIKDLAKWIEDEKPTNAELSCSLNSDICNEVKDILAKYKINYKLLTSANDNSIALIYNKTEARDCSFGKAAESRSKLGCAVSSNILQMIGDYQQITKPKTLDNTSVRSYVDFKFLKDSY